jgi:hypothetical protein
VSSPGRESRSSYNTLRLLVQPVVEAQGKGGVVADGLVLVKVYPPGWSRRVGNEGLWVVGVSGSWDKISFLLFGATSLLSLPSLEFPYPVEFSPSSGVTHY